MPQPLTVDESSFQNPKLRDARLVAYKALADFAGKGSLFIITIVAARRMSSQSFGVFSLGSTLGWLLAVAADSGIQLHLARAVARAPDGARPLLDDWWRVRRWTAAVAVVFAAVGVAAAGLRGVAVPILLLAVVYACSGLIEFLYYFFRGLSRSDIESSLTVWQRAATLACGLLVLAWRPTAGALAIAMLLPTCATLAVSVRIATQLRPRSVEPAGRQGTHHESSVATKAIFFRDVFPIGAGIVFSALYFRIDVFLVQWWAGTEAVAYYNAVFRLVEALRLFPAAVVAIALPTLCRARDARPLAYVSLWVTAFAMVLSALLWVGADWIVPSVYGARYAPAVFPFRILVLSFPLLSVNYALTHQLVGWDGQRAYAGICALALVVNLVLNARLIPAMAIEGAAWATLGTEVAVTAGCLLALASVRARTPVVEAVLG